MTNKIIDEFTDRDDLTYYQKHYLRNKEVLSKRSNEFKTLRKIKDVGGYLCTRIRNRAKERGFDFNLEASDFEVPEKCPVLGIEMLFTKERTDNTPTVDRIDSTKGYVKGNIAMISWRANRLKHNGSLKEFENLVTYMRKYLT